MTALATITTFLAATLTFVLELFTAKMILPLFGGTASVWNTCMLFFQGMLLAGYGYAHWAAGAKRWRATAIGHVGLLGLAVLALPVAIGAEWAPAAERSPVWWQLRLLLATVGLPFFVVAATTPLVQRWVSLRAGEGAADPYSLYAASNLGSLAALLAYPLVLEPAFDVAQVSRLWTGGYVALVVLMAGCAAVTLRTAAGGAGAERAEAEKPSRATPWRWFALAFVPSSLMLSVTTHLSTNVASAPLLWVLPLALYLGTYILAFARRRWYSTEGMERALPLAALMLTIVLLAEALEPPPWIQFALHLGGLLIAGLALHGQLAELRPPVAELTRYYFWMALGGFAGGVFNALIAPAIFGGIVEYPLAVVMACLLRRPPRDAKDALPRSGRDLLRKDLLPAAALGAATLAAVRAAGSLGLGSGREAVAIAAGVPAVICYLLLKRPVRFAAGLGALLLAGSLGTGAGSDVLFARRTYYGLHRVRREGRQNRLYHGPTLHGIQNIEGEARQEPLAYYHRTGPAGSLFRTLEARGTLERVGVVGCGVGSLAAYGRAGQRWTFYELDPAVAFVAKDTGYFTFWKDAPASLRMVTGDGRTSLARESERFDLLVLDAFSSDAVPAHLLTREALRLYRERLTAKGSIVYHISNRFLDLENVVASLAQDAGMTAVGWADLELADALRDAGKLPSHWMVLTTDAGLVEALQSSGGWLRTVGRADGVWTDGYSNVVGVVRWGS